MFDILNSKGDKDIYRMTKRRQTKTNDISIINCIKVNDNTSEREHQRSIEGIFDELFNGEQGTIVSHSII